MDKADTAAQTQDSSTALVHVPAEPERRKPGRPSSYTPELAERVLAALPNADCGIEQVCAEPGMPSMSTVFRWLHDPKRDEFRQQYARARDEQAEVQAGRASKEALSAYDAQLGRLRWDARRWYASKLAPKRYGERVQAELSGPGGGPVEVTAVAGARGRLRAKLGLDDEAT